MEFVKHTTKQRPTKSTASSGSRRVYLDTYGKKRTAAIAQPAAKHPERATAKATSASIPMSFTPEPVQQVFHQHQQNQVRQKATPTNAKTHTPQQLPRIRTNNPALMRALSRRAITLTKAHNVVRQLPQRELTNAVANQFPIAAQAQKVQDPHEQIEANLKALYSPSLTEQLQKADTKSASHIRTVLLSGLACGVLSLSIFAFATRVDPQPVIAQPVGAPVIEVEVPVKQKAPEGRAKQTTNNYVAAKPIDPVKVVISDIGVNAQIEGLGITSEGLIATPKAYGLVGWYNKGKTVSEAGPTVLVGHYAGGFGAVFDKLGNVKNGTLITVTTKEGKSYTYKVSKKVEYPKDKVPMQQIFKDGDESRLEIITCQGAWQGNTYDNRLVVTAEIVK